MKNDIDNKMLKLTLPLPTSVNHIYGRNKFGSTYLKKEGKEYKKVNGDYIKEQVKSQDWTKLQEGEYCYLYEVVYMNTKGRDADNLKKITQDTITESEVVWIDDTYCLPMTRRIYIDSKNPRLEITLIPTQTVGIFENNDDYIEFEDKCKRCSQYRKGSCGTLKDTKDNRISDIVILENDKWICNRFKMKKK